MRDDIPEALRRGVFGTAGCRFEALVRFSNGRARDDRRADAHGMAIKLLDVPGTKLLAGRENERAQDFILVDSDTFFTGDPVLYALVNRALLATRWWHRLRAWLAILVRPRLLLRIIRFAGNRPRSPLAVPYFSAVPYRLGGAAVKYVAMPRGNEPDRPVDGEDGLARALARSLATTGKIFYFGIDLQTDADSQPIEDPTRSWSAAGARRIWLAELTLPVQWVEPAAPIAENLCFSPWHALPAHEPLGYINRARAPIYQAMQAERHRCNHMSPRVSSEAPAAYGQKPRPLARPDAP